MWEKLLVAIKDFIVSGELTRRNSDDIRELRRRNEELSLLVERLAFEIQRIRENEAHEREKLALRLGDQPVVTEKKRLPKKRG